MRYIFSGATLPDLLTVLKTWQAILSRGPTPSRIHDCRLPLPRTLATHHKVTRMQRAESQDNQLATRV